MSQQTLDHGAAQPAGAVVPQRRRLRAPPSPSPLSTLAADDTHRSLGQYYTTNYNPFRLPPFRAWARKARLECGTLLEPFAGGNHLVSMLREAGWSGRCDSFDLHPGSTGVKKLDTIEGFPRGYASCVSNPPWLGRSSAARRRIPYPRTRYDDVYKHCLGLALANCDNVAFLLPASFLRSGLFRDRLRSIAFLHRRAFDGTENPTCLAMFHRDRAPAVTIWHDDAFVGELASLERLVPPARPRVAARLRFNDPRGPLGLVCIDDTHARTIRFCRGPDLPHRIRHSSRSITRIGGISVDGGLIGRLNRGLGRFRTDTRDVFLTPFKGLRGDGEYRRRLDYKLARRLISAYA